MRFVERDPLLREEEADLLRVLGENVGDLHGHRRVHERERPQLGQELRGLLRRKARELLGMLVGEGGLTGEGTAGGLLHKEVLHLREGDRFRHRPSPRRRA